MQNNRRPANRRSRWHQASYANDARYFACAPSRSSHSRRLESAPPNKMMCFMIDARRVAAPRARISIVNACPYSPYTISIKCATHFLIAQMYLRAAPVIHWAHARTPRANCAWFDDTECAQWPGQTVVILRPQQGRHADRIYWRRARPPSHTNPCPAKHVMINHPARITCFSGTPN